MLRCNDGEDQLLLGHEVDPWEAVDVDSDVEDEFKPRQYIIFDVGGTRFQGCKDNFVKYPKTRLGRLISSNSIEEILELCDEYTPGDPPEYFFDRNPENFPSVLEMYRSGKFHIPDSARSCVMVMRRDYTFWGLDELNLEPCCALKFYPEMQNCVIQTDMDTEEKIKEDEMLATEDFGEGKLAKIRSNLWDFLEKPWTSKPAQLFAIFSMSILFISTITFIVSTVGEFSDEYSFEDRNNSTEAIGGVNELIIVCNYVDIFTFIFFTIEYSMRFTFCPKKWQFFKESMNFIDFITLLPFYISLILEGLEDYQIISRAGKMIRLMKILKIFRVYKLFRHFAGLRSLLYTLKQAYKELGLLFHVIGVTVLTFASIVYLCEAEFNISNRHGLLNSTWTFVDGFWWSLMTITTVGSDLNPITNVGKLFGGLCALSGVFLLTLPLPIVVQSFSGFYKNRLWRNEVAAKKRDRIRRGIVPRRKSSTSGLRNMSSGVPRSRYRFQHGVMQMNMMRSKEEMTVADMHSLVYDMYNK